MIEDISHLTDRLKAVSEQTKTEFGTLSEEQFNWKPQSDKWSIGQCIDHIIRLNETYFPEFDALINGQKTKTVWEVMPLLPKMWGALLLKSVQPVPKRKVKTTPVFEPAQSNIPPGRLNDLARNNEVVSDYFQKLATHQKVIITSPAASFITYSIHDTMILITNHEERHLHQARNVFEMEAFPK